MADDFSIKIKAILDASKQDLDGQIDKLAGKLKGIDLGLNKDTLVILSNFVSSLDKAKDISKEMTKAVKEEVTEIKKLDGTVERITKQFLRNGEIVEKTKKIIKEQKDEIDNSTQSAGKLLDEWDKIGNKIKEVSRNDGQGKFTGGTSTFKDDFTQQQIKYNNDLEVTSEKVTQNLLQEQNAVEKLKASLSDMSRIGLLSSDELKKFSTAINTKDFEKANALYSQLIDKQKELLRIQSLGENKGKIDGSIFNLADDNRIKALSDYVRELYQSKGATDDLEKTQISLARTFDMSGNEIYKYNIAIKDGSGVAKTYSGNIDRLSKSLYENSIRTRDATTRSLGLAEQFKIAASRVPIWLGEMRPIY